MEGGAPRRRLADAAAELKQGHPPASPGAVKNSESLVGNAPRSAPVTMVH